VFQGNGELSTWNWGVCPLILSIGGTSGTYVRGGSTPVHALDLGRGSVPPVPLEPLTFLTYCETRHLEAPLPGTQGLAHVFRLTVLVAPKCKGTKELREWNTWPVSTGAEALRSRPPRAGEGEGGAALRLRCSKRI